MPSLTVTYVSGLSVTDVSGPYLGSRWSPWQPPQKLIDEMPPMRQTLYRGTHCANNVPGFNYGGQNQRDRPLAEI